MKNIIIELKNKVNCLLEKLKLIELNLLNYQLKSEKSQVNGYASLDNNGIVPLSELPSQVNPNDYIPYVGAIQDVDLGDKNILFSQSGWTITPNFLLSPSGDKYNYPNTSSSRIATELTTDNLQQAINNINLIIGSSNPDADNIVNTVSELMAVFANFPELPTILSILNNKQNKTDNANLQLVSGSDITSQKIRLLDQSISSFINVDQFFAGTTNKNMAGQIILPVLTTLDGNNYNIISTNAIVNIAPTNIQIATTGLINGDTATKFLTDNKIEYWAYTNVWTLIKTVNPTTLDGNDTHIVRSGNTTGIAPTNLEVVTPMNGDTAKVQLLNSNVEFWSYTTTWVLNFTIVNGGSPFNLSGFIIDAQGNKIASISRTGKVRIGDNNTPIGIIDVVDGLNNLRFGTGVTLGGTVTDAILQLISNGGSWRRLGTSGGNLAIFTDGFETTGNSPTIFLDTSKNVGIGNINPRAKLEVSGSVILGQRPTIFSSALTIAIPNTFTDTTSNIKIEQTVNNATITIANPIQTSGAGRILRICNSELSTKNIIFSGKIALPNQFIDIFWNGNTWSIEATQINDQSSVGYYDIGNLRHQWGQGNTNGTIFNNILPAPFLNNTYSVIATINGTFGNSNALVMAIASKTTTAFGSQCQQFNNNSSSIIAASGQTFNWIAIGLKP